MTLKKPDQNAYVGTFATSLFIQACTVLQGILLARMLGPAGRGEFAAIILWPNVFAGFGILGINMALARFAGQDHPAARLVKAAVKAALATGVLSALICGVALPELIPVDKHNLLPLAYLFLLYIPLNHFALNLQGIDHGYGKFTWLNVSRAILYPVYFAGLLLCWFYAENKVFWAVVALLVANFAVVFFLLCPKIKYFLRNAQKINPRALFDESWPFVIASIIGILYMQMDKALLVWMLSPAEIGWYVAAFAAAGSVNVLNNSLGIVQFSSAAQAESGFGFRNLASVLRRGGLLSLFGAITLAFLLPFLIPLVYGSAFRPAVPMALILLPGLIFAGLGQVINQALSGQGRPIAGVISKVFGLIVMAVLGILLARNWGGSGIAVSYLAGELVAFVGLLLVALRYYKDSFWGDLLPTRSDLLFIWAKVFRRKKKTGI